MARCRVFLSCPWTPKCVGVSASVLLWQSKEEMNKSHSRLSLSLWAVDGVRKRAESGSIKTIFSVFPCLWCVPLFMICALCFISTASSTGAGVKEWLQAKTELLIAGEMCNLSLFSLGIGFLKHYDRRLARWLMGRIVILAVLEVKVSLPHFRPVLGRNCTKSGCTIFRLVYDLDFFFYYYFIVYWILRDQRLELGFENKMSTTWLVLLLLRLAFVIFTVYYISFNLQCNWFLCASSLVKAVCFNRKRYLMVITISWYSMFQYYIWEKSVIYICLFVVCGTWILLFKYKKYFIMKFLILGPYHCFNIFNINI